MITEGYWYADNKHDENYPKIESQINKIKINQEFLDQLKIVSKFGYWYSWMGYSSCRLCVKDNNGDSDIITHDDKYKFPSGLIHYFENHNVHPTKEFYDYVINYIKPTQEEFHIHVQRFGMFSLRLLKHKQNTFDKKYASTFDKIPDWIEQKQRENQLRILDRSAILGYSK
jgi:hypothetical protein